MGEDHGRGSRRQWPVRRLTNRNPAYTQRGVPLGDSSYGPRRMTSSGPVPISVRPLALSRRLIAAWSQPRSRSTRLRGAGRSGGHLGDRTSAGASTCGARAASSSAPQDGRARTPRARVERAMGLGPAPAYSSLTSRQLSALTPQTSSAWNKASSRLRCQ